MSNDPDQIRAEIDRTRRDLSRNVDALGEQVKPGNVARRQTEKVGEAVSDRLTSVKEAVMGAADDVTDRVGGDDGPSMGDRMRDQAEDLRYGAQQQMIDARRGTRRRAKGNPLAAGLVALGAGWLVGSLIPASRKEQEAAAAFKEQARPLVENAQEWAKDTGEQLREPAQAAFADVKDSAAESLERVKAEGTDVADDVKDHGRQAAAEVREESRSAAADVKESGVEAGKDVKKAKNDNGRA
ncbi:DUF3618 domain-containing protein [Mobilicoccus pelagius]|uniref:DUF3618 domain-containing protein n=1 Tax=Mobilicoccus pelagius NBRC 104925 TaxID=1089455 RepID=H5UVD5_9MICO|nr:DUF3618 domain-containing protein [Mobilicoccus pelagius]GAB49693.1 hypothetical protein MOPEL_132_00600 [Mobilicoccus pelagius NBRC 104925]